MNGVKKLQCVAGVAIFVLAGATLSFADSGTAFEPSAAMEEGTLYFAQMADGGGYITQVVLSNPGVTDVTATLEAFKTGTAGAPLTVTFNGQTSSRFTWKIKAHGSLFLKSAGAASRVETGWIRVKATGSLGGSLTYSCLSGGKTISEAGLDPSTLLADFHLAVDTRQGYYAGLAVANPGSTPSEVRLVLYDSDGNWKAQSTQPLGAMQQMAKLVEEIFPGKNLADFTGTVTASATGGSVIATTLRMDKEVGTMSSIPVIAGFPAPAPPTGVAYVSLSGPCSLASVGEITQLQANANSRDGFLQDVTAQTTWKSSHPAVASVSPTGLVTAVAPGIVEITAAFGNLNASAGISAATPVDFSGTWVGSSSSTAGNLSWSGTVRQTGHSFSASATAEGGGLNYASIWSGTISGATAVTSGTLSNAGGTVCTWNDGRCILTAAGEFKCVSPLTCVNGSFSMSYITATRK